MEKRHLILIASLPTSLVVLLLLIIHACCKRSSSSRASEHVETNPCCEEKTQTEELIRFHGGGNLSIIDILDANGEVVGKSGYGTVYKASLQANNGLVMLLRFLRPACTKTKKDILPEIETLGYIRQPNLIPLQAFYSGPRGEILLVYPFFPRGTLSQFIQNRKNHATRYTNFYSISISIAKGLEYLHSGLARPLVHGNLKSKNILLDVNYQPCLSDYGIHMLLNRAANQEMLEASAAEGYKAPELLKMKEASTESDVYSLGIILLELLTGKEAVVRNSPSGKDVHLLTIMRNAIISHRVSETFDPLLLSKDQNLVTEEGLLLYFQLAMSCCTLSSSFRPDIRQVRWQLEAIAS